MKMTRRQTLQWALGGSAYLLGSQSQARQMLSALDGTTAAPTPACGKPTDYATAGPFYTPDTPERQDLREAGVEGEPFMLIGRVFDQACRPLTNAMLDFWSCDGSGEYDNQGFRLRGHQFTDEHGGYILHTVKPGSYGRKTLASNTSYSRQGGRSHDQFVNYPTLLPQRSFE